MYIHKFTYVLHKGSLLFLFSIYVAIVRQYCVCVIYRIRMRFLLAFISQNGQY